jgi:hypothetical protein
MAYMILRKLERGELLKVATVHDLQEALRLAEGLYEYWPAEYSVRNSESGADIPINYTVGRTHEALCEWHPHKPAQQWRN